MLPPDPLSSVSNFFIFIMIIVSKYLPGGRALYFTFQFLFKFMYLT